MSIAIANRYAHALADVVQKEGNYRQVRQELEDFGAVYGANAELQEVYTTPAIPVEKKLDVLEAIAQRLGSSHVTLNFLRVLVSHYRLAMIGEVIQSFRNVANARMGIVQVKISTAAGLSNDEQATLRARFDELTRQQSELEFHLDGNLIGGIVAQIGSTVYDGSIRGRLDRIQGQLAAQ